MCGAALQLSQIQSINGLLPLLMIAQEQHGFIFSKKNQKKPCLSKTFTKRFKLNFKVRFSTPIWLKMG